MVVEFQSVQTLGVLGGAYKGKDIGERALLTHIAFISAEGYTIRTGCAVKADNLVDEYAHAEDERTSRPTCPTCAKKWDKIQASTSIVP